MTTTQKLPCAFCGDYTELVRACLTPQCESCQIDRELDPKLPCLPECSFSHTVTFTEQDSITCQRQIQLLQILAELFRSRIITVDDQVQAKLNQVQRNLDLARLYQRLGLTTAATIKAQDLIQDQLQFQRQQCQEAITRLDRATASGPVNPVNQEQSVQLTQLYRQIDRTDTFLANYREAEIPVLLLDYQSVPDQTDIINLGSFQLLGQAKLEQLQCGYTYPATFIPGTEILLFGNYRQDRQDHQLDKVYYHLTRQEKSHDDAPWLPLYYDFVDIHEIMNFSDTGVWLYHNKSLRHKRLDLWDSAESESEEPHITTLRPHCLISRGDHMVMTVDSYTDNGIESSCSAWRLQPNSLVWTRLWSRDLRWRLKFSRLSFTGQTNDKVVIAEFHKREIVIRVLDFTTAAVLHQAEFNFRNSIDYAVIIDDAIHIIFRQHASLTCYLYSLTGQLLAEKLLPEWDRPNKSPIVAVVKSQGRIKICYRQRDT